FDPKTDKISYRPSRTVPTRFAVISVAGGTSSSALPFILPDSFSPSPVSIAAWKEFQLCEPGARQQDRRDPVSSKARCKLGCRIPALCEPNWATLHRDALLV